MTIVYIHVIVRQLIVMLPMFSFVLTRFKDAWSFASAIDSVDSWTTLGEVAVQHLDIDFGITALLKFVHDAGVYLGVVLRVLKYSPQSQATGRSYGWIYKYCTPFICCSFVKT